MNSQRLVIMSIFHFLKANISVFQYGWQKSCSRSAWINLKHFSILEICSLKNVQYFSISLAEKDVAVNFEEPLELTVILGLPAHFIGPRCITKEFRDTVFKYLRFAVLQHSIVVSNIQHTVFACMYVCNTMYALWLLASSGFLHYHYYFYYCRLLTGITSRCDYWTRGANKRGISREDEGE